MEGPQPKNNNADISVNSDYISNLPADIKEKILIELSLKEAVRTSILSSSWKDSWTLLPNLVFPNFIREEKSTESGLIELVDKVLQVHRGPIKKFRLVSRHACNEAIGRWMLILSTNKIEHLDLFFCGDACRKGEIPSCFFSCNTLKSVFLSGFSINVPQFFNDFTLLHTLCLHHFNLSVFVIEKLVSSCPLLEHLDLSTFVQQGCLRILAPKLTFLAICGVFNDICLETPKLVEGIICLHGVIGDYAKDGKEINITRALGQLSNIQKLAILGKFIDHLAMGPIPKNLPPMFNHLSKLSVDLGSGWNEISAALYLFQNAPNLKQLQIKCSYFDYPPYVGDWWELKAIRDCLFKRLEVVNILLDQVSGSLNRTKSMLEFAKLVLSTAPLLEKFRVRHLKDDMVVFKELKLFPKLSEKCKIDLLLDSRPWRW
ncbi:F-box/FBD/LRR-repeat protein At1g13570-like [Carex rostrata]